MNEDRVKRVAEAIKKVDVPDCSGTRPHNNVLARAAMAAILTPDEEREIQFAAAEVEGFNKLGSEILTALLKDLQGEKA